MYGRFDCIVKKTVWLSSSMIYHCERVGAKVKVKNVSSIQVYMRALFSYNPEKDDLLPNKELGLKFQSGDILEIVESQKDPNWWQVYNHNTHNSIESSAIFLSDKKCFE